MRINSRAAASAGIVLLASMALLLGCDSPLSPHDVQPSVSVGAQVGALTAGSAGTASYQATAVDIDDGTTGSIAWYAGADASSSASAPAGISATVSAISGGAATVTMDAAPACVAGTYYFRLTEGAATSAVATLLVGAAPGGPSVSLGAQAGDIAPGAGSATFAVASSGIAVGTAGSFSWYSSAAGTTATGAPTGIAPTVGALAADGTATVNIAASQAASPGIYYFRLKEGSASSAVAVLSVKPAAPAAFVANAYPNVPRVYLSWTKVAGLSYTVYRSASLGAAGLPLATGLTANYYYDNSVSNGNWYYYAVTATHAQAGESAPTAQSSTRVASANNNLASLELSRGDLVPAFSPSTTSYFVILPVGTSTITVTGAPQDPLATLGADNGQSMTLSAGPNSVKIVATSESGSAKTYAVNAIVAGAHSTTVGDLMYVAGGTFLRSAAATDTTYVSPMYMGRDPVTRAQFAAVMGVDPSDATKSTGTDDPVQQVSLYYAIAFCNKLSLLEGLTPAYGVTGVTNWATLNPADIPAWSSSWDNPTIDWSANGYRLPTQMEYTWAAMDGLSDARAGDISGGINVGGYTKGYAGSLEPGSTTSDIGRYAWTSVNASGTKPVEGKLPNELGVFDLSGNVVERCWDFSYNIPSGPLSDYPGYGTNQGYRVAMGGSWSSFDSGCDIAVSTGVGSTSKYNYMGFRVVRR